MRKLSFILLVTAVILAFTSLQADAQGKKSRNIIQFIDDGMGVTQWYTGIALVYFAIIVHAYHFNDPGNI